MLCQHAGEGCASGSRTDFHTHGRLRVARWCSWLAGPGAYAWLPLMAGAAPAARVSIGRSRAGTRGKQMTDQTAATLGTKRSPAARLEPDAIGGAQDTVLGVARSPPGARVGA